jgi:hypothetical protein
LAANRVASRHYGGDSIAFERYEQWRLKNRQILVCLLDHSQEVVGYFDILPLRSNFVDAFLSGRVVEHQIGPDDILAPQHAGRCRRLYLGGISVMDPNSHAGKRHADILVWGLLKYIAHHYGPLHERKLFALAATKPGEQLLKRFGFQISSPASQRIDGHNLYVLSLTAEAISDALRARPDWSSVCTVSWELPHPKREHLAAGGSQAV